MDRHRHTTFWTVFPPWTSVSACLIDLYIPSTSFLSWGLFVVQENRLSHPSTTQQHHTRGEKEEESTKQLHHHRPIRDQLLSFFPTLLRPARHGTSSTLPLLQSLYCGFVEELLEDFPRRQIYSRSSSSSFSSLRKSRLPRLTHSLNSLTLSLIYFPRFIQHIT